MDGEIDWQSRAERAEKACAEMRNICEGILNASKEQFGWPLAIWTHLVYAAENALSDSCGKDYVRREELEATKGALAHTQDALEACEKASGFVPCDTSLPMWIANTKEELDAAKAENARLRSALEFAANSYREMATDEALSQMLYEVANIAKQALAGKEGE